MTETFTELSASEAAAESGAVGPKLKLTEATRLKVVEAWELFESATNGSWTAKAKLRESLSTSDFPLYFGAALDAKLLAAYQAITPTWSGYASRDVVPDFREQTWIDIFGGQGDLDAVGEGGPYKRKKLSEGEGSYRVFKYGNTIGLTWEMLINDRLGGFRTLPERLAVAAREKEDRIATLQLTDGNGPNANLFSSTAVKGLAGATSTNLLSGNPALTEVNLGAALLAISTRVDYDGRPVILQGAVLVVPPALQLTAERIVAATTYEETVGTTKVTWTNPYAGKVRVVVNPWLQVLDAGANAATTWYVLPEPSANGRPAVVVAFLAGHETPDLRVKNDQGTRIGGGTIAPEEGSFEFDTIDYRVRHVLGGGSVDANQGAYSNGSGS